MNNDIQNIVSLTRRFEDRIMRLPKNKAVLYSLLSAYRMQFYYVAYWRKHKFGDPDLYNRILEYCENYLNGREIDFEEGILMATTFSLEIIDTNDDGSIYGTITLEAGCAAEVALATIVYPKTTNPQDSFAHVYEPLNMFLAEILSNEYGKDPSELQIWNHNEMKKEMQLQEQIISHLERIEEVNAHEIDVVKDNFMFPPINLNLFNQK